MDKKAEIDDSIIPQAHERIKMPLQLWITIAALSSVAGLIGAFVMQDYGQYLSFLSFKSWSATILRFLIGFFGLGFLLVFFKKLRLLAVFMLCFSFTFHVSGAFAHKFAWQRYVDFEEARLGYSVNATKSMNEWLEELEKCLTVGDNRSRLRILDYSEKSSESRIPFGWKKCERIEDVLKRFKVVIPCEMTVDLQGNPWCIGPMHGTLFEITLKNREVLNEHQNDPVEKKPDHLEPQSIEELLKSNP